MDDHCVKVILLTVTILMTVSSAVSETFEFRMQEEQKAGYVVGNILEQYKSDRDELRFTLMRQGNAYESYFEVEEISGNLTTKQIIDREVLCEFTNICQVSLDVAAQTVLNDGFFDVVNILIIVEDINDNAPTFSESSFNLPLSESVLTGSTITVEGARDKDTSDKYSLQTYDLQPTIPGENLPFQFNFSKKLDGSSTINLIVKEKLNREEKDSYQFYIVAKDGGSPPKEGNLLVNVSVTDINDNNPVFEKSSYDITVNEDVNVNDVILTLKVSDDDLGMNGEVRFRLSSFQPKNNLKYFSIDETLGHLKIKEKLNANAGDTFRLIVEATDLGNPSLTTQAFVHVSVLDTSNSAPEIHLNLLTNANYSTISEYANIGAVVAHVAIVDHDTGRNGNVNCSVLSDVFGLQRYDVHEYKVIVSRSLDRERAATHNVSIRCEDKGVPPLSNTNTFLVHINDENDNPPRFRQQRYFSSIDENNEIGDKITTVSAFDLDSGNNSVISYSVAPASSKYAYVDPKTGLVMANKVFDKESKEGQGISLTIYCKDNGVPALTGTTSVIVTINDQNDEKPVFDQTLFRFWLDENLPADTSVDRLSAKDKDKNSNALTKYSLKSGQSEVPFVVLEDGVIKTNRELDREEKDEYTFDVVATDVGNESLFNVAKVTVFIVDKNDNNPVIQYPKPGNNTASVSFLTPPRTVVYSVIAYDMDEPYTDNSNLRYSMTTINKTNFFSIDPQSGDILLSAPLENTNSVGKVYVLSITVRDSGENTYPATATLRILITTENGTMTTSTEEPNKNFVIVVVVAAVTILISAGIIVTICIIRRLDTRRRDDKQRQKVLNENMYTKNNDEVDNIFPLPMDTSFTEKKKKEVSFSLEENGMMNHSQANSGSDDPDHDSFEQILLEVSQIRLFFFFQSKCVLFCI
ncbi:protocadherin-11 X-linked-like [Mercenaria mercenaria]|uniref:protocadherin-11 X-linked-like n=1 Tax=Mercenaria mercenaria TaxID=6596 RepID=UPI00234FB5AA|nr:protocadherin-11 X-linked-like [Mercenaria mercenaria]